MSSSEPKPDTSKVLESYYDVHHHNGVDHEIKIDIRAKTITLTWSFDGEVHEVNPMKRKLGRQRA